MVRRKLIKEIARKPRVEKREGRMVVVGKMFPSLNAIAVEYACVAGEAVASATVSRDLRAVGVNSRVRPRVVNNDPSKNKARLTFAKGV